MEIWLKRCTKCPWFKSLNAFGPHKGGKGGKNSRCLDCSRKYYAGYREGHREELRVKSAEYFATHTAQHQATVRAYDASHRKERKAYRETHKEETNLKKRQDYAEDPQKFLTRHKEWMDSHPEKSQEYRVNRTEQRAEEWAQWAATHQPELQEYRRTHAEQIAAKGKRWSAANREREALNEQRRRARKQELPDTWTPEQLMFMLEYWQYACAACGNPKGLLWVLAHDHWVPLASPDCPGTVATNMIPLCHGTGGCNNSKNGADPHAWLIRRFGQKKAAKIEKAIATYFTIVAERFSVPLFSTTSTEKGA